MAEYQQKLDLGPAHSPLGPSSAKRWINCPGSVALSAGIPDSDSLFALEGTAAHTLSEWCRRDNKPAKDYIGQTITEPRVDGGTFKIEVKADMADHIQEFLDYVNSQPSDFSINEGRVSYEAWVENGWGTLDDARISAKTRTCYITDLKYGKGVQVFVKGNEQLMCYGLGIFEEFGHLYEFDNFQFNVHQPRLDHVDEWTVPVVEVLKWAEDVLAPAALATKAPNAAIVPGEWCQFCRAKATCKTRAAWVESTVVNDFEDLGDEAATLRAADKLTNEELATKYLPRVAAIKAWCNDVEAYALSQVQKGIPIGAYKLVEGRSKRIVKDAAAALKYLGNLRGLKIDEFAPRKLGGIGILEKLLGKKHKFFAEYIDKPPGKPVLVDGADPRPAIHVDPNAEFADLGEEDDE